jgi:hypothetical protein
MVRIHCWYDPNIIGSGDIEILVIPINRDQWIEKLDLDVTGVCYGTIRA